MERQQLFKEYRNSRQIVLDLRNEDRQRRNEAKAKQIELAEQWQVDAHTKLNGRLIKKWPMKSWLSEN